MTTSVEPPRTPEGPEPRAMSKKEVKGQAAAAEAYAKSQKSWPARHKFLTGLGALAVVGGIATATQGGGTDTSGAAAPQANTPAASAPQANTPAAPAAEMAGLNAPVRDGNFEFTVKSVKCGISSIGPVGVVEKAQGQFCVAKLHVSNVGTEAQMFMAINQYAFNAEGSKYSASSALGVAMQYGETFLKDINPGNAVDGSVAFDVPKTVKITRLELHDSPFSGGVSVKAG